MGIVEAACIRHCNQTWQLFNYWDMYILALLVKWNEAWVKWNSSRAVSPIFIPGEVHILDHQTLLSVKIFGSYGHHSTYYLRSHRMYCATWILVIRRRFLRGKMPGLWSSRNELSTDIFSLFHIDRYSVRAQSCFETIIIYCLIW